MKTYITQLPSLPNWKVKVKTMWLNGRCTATVSLPTDNGVVSLFKEHEDEHTALHRVIDTVDELMRRIQTPRAELARMN